jgi:hypothetical protein
VYALKQAGLNMDLAAYPKRGEFYPPIDFGSVTLTTSPIEGLSLSFPSPEAQAQLLEMIQETPAEQLKQGEEVLTEEIEELVEERPAEPVKAAEPAPVVKGGALMKQAEGRAFDFMSNRPVPRSKPAEPTPAASETAVERSTPVEPSRHLKFESQAETSRKAIADLRHTILDTRARSAEDTLTSIRNVLRGNVEASGSQSSAVEEPVGETKYRHVPLSDPAIKFAVSFQRLSNPIRETIH